MTRKRWTRAKAFHKDVFIDQERKLGDRRRSDTVVVSTINDADLGLDAESHFLFLCFFRKAKDMEWKSKRSTCVLCIRNGCVWTEQTLPGLLREIEKLMGFGGSMVARQKLKGIDGRAHQEWSVRLNLTQHGETYQGQIAWGLTD